MDYIYRRIYENFQMRLGQTARPGPGPHGVFHKYPQKLLKPRRKNILLTKPMSVTSTLSQ
jgi:hypothetical protein